jgi:hypothetical protein
MNMEHWWNDRLARENLLNCYIRNLLFEIRFYDKGLPKLLHFLRNVCSVIALPILEIEERNSVPVVRK